MEETRKNPAASPGSFPSGVKIAGMRTTLAFICALSTLVPAWAAADTLGRLPFDRSMSAAIDRIGKREVTAGRTPGLAIAVVEDGRWVYARGFGYASLKPRRTVSASTEFYAGGLTDQFTAAAILLLAQDGKLKLSDKVTKYVPELTVAKDVTVEQLLQQTSGLPDYTHAGIAVVPTRRVPLATFVAAVDKLPLRSVPGTKFAYNNFNYMIAGLVVERAGGLPLSDFLQARIFQPLLMSSTFMAGDTGISPLTAIGYTGAPGHFVPVHPWDPSWMLGAGGLVTDVYDLAKWDIGFPLLLRDDAVREMFAASGASGLAYGMGWVVDQRGGQRYLWHNGELAGYHAMNALLPDQHVAVIVLANADGLKSNGTIAPEQVAAQILDVVSPLPRAHVENAIVARAKEWLARLAAKDVDRTQLTPRFSAYLTDALVSTANFGGLGKLQAIVPTGSSVGANGDTVYEFLVRYPKAEYRYKMSIAPEGKIDGLVLMP